MSNITNHERLAVLLKNGPVITDGGWGTQLQLRGLEPGMMPDLWNLSQPNKVQEVAAAYIEAGSQIILTNTFGSTRYHLARNGMSDKVRELNRLGVQISRQAAAGRTKVFASVGPSGMMLCTGQVTEDELYEVFLEQVLGIVDGEADGIVVETMSDPNEAVLAVRAAKTTGLPVVCSMTFDSGKAKDRTMMGTTPEQAARILTDAGVDVIGANCGQGIDGFIPLCSRLKAATSLPIWVKANAGLPEMVDGQTIYRQTPEVFAEKAKQLVAAGASFIGGCCGTSPEFIAALVHRFANMVH